MMFNQLVMIRLMVTHLQMIRILVMILKPNQHPNMVSIVLIIIIIISIIILIIIISVYSNTKTSSLAPTIITNTEMQSTFEQGYYILI